MRRGGMVGLLVSFLTFPFEDGDMLMTKRSTQIPQGS